MAPVSFTEDALVEQKEQFFEASVLHRIPTELLIQSSSSTQYFQSFPNGRVYRSWLLRRKRNSKEERLRKMAKFHAELLGKSIENDTTFIGEGYLSTSREDSSNLKNVSAATKNSSVDRNELLLDITLKTMVLLHHNQQLQNKLTALQMETRNFVRSSSRKTMGPNCAASQNRDD